jgi:Cu-Zn family superoxide dismutase
MQRYKTSILIGAIFLLIAIGLVVDWKPTYVSVSKEMPYYQIVNANGDVIGSVMLTEGKNGVLVHVTASHLSPGRHGFHFHEKWFEGTDFTTAGEHFNPKKKKHGYLNPKGYHLGDMPNLVVNADGNVSTEVFVPGVTLVKGKPNSLAGRSLIIHSGADDYSTDPAGNSGDRIAGANIGK